MTATEAERALDASVRVELYRTMVLCRAFEDAILRSVSKTRCVVTAEEHQRNGGLGDAVAQLLARKMPLPQEYVAVNDSFGESGTPDELMKKYGLDTADIVAAAELVLSRK